MKAREDKREEARIVVAFDATPLEALALDAAAALASALDAELAGIYVEDTNLARIAAFPFVREYGAASAAPRSIAARDMEHALRYQAARHREELAALAAALRLRWSFQVVRGRSLAAVIEQTREPDVVVIGKAGRGVAARSLTLAEFGRSLGRRTGGGAERFRQLGLHSVAALFDGTPKGWRALAAAHAVAAIAGARLALLVLASDGREFERLRESVRVWLDQHQVRARFVWLRSSEVEDIVALVQDAAALFWHEPAFESERLEALIAALPCPLVLIY
jgi:hypothetical protein